MSGIRKILNPELFQGGMRRRNYFEGWYFKLTRGDAAAAVIPGVALGGSPGSQDSHAFVQFILGNQTYYFRYPLESFRADTKAFRFTVGNNSFSREGVSLDLSNERGRICGALRFSDILPFPKMPLCPGIMGPFGFVPGMECYHGIVNIRHRIDGSIEALGRMLDFTGGAGYIEKDWGHAFPSAWIWVQANHFEGDAAFLFSAAKIPWLGRSFDGFFAFLYHAGELRRFATYTGARILRLAQRGGALEGALQDRRGQLEFSAVPGRGGTLKAPKNGLMNRDIEECLCATVRVALTDPCGRTLFEGDSGGGGMEQYDAECLFRL